MCTDPVESHKLETHAEVNTRFEAHGVVADWGGLPLGGALLPKKSMRERGVGGPCVNCVTERVGDNAAFAIETPYHNDR